MFNQCHHLKFRAFSRQFYPKRLTLHSRYTFDQFVHMSCVCKDSMIPELDLVLQDLKAEELYMIVTDRETHTDCINQY